MIFVYKIGMMKPSIKILFLLALSLLALNNTSFAQKEKGGKKLSGKAKHAMELGDKYFANDDYFLAAQEYKKALESDSLNGDALYKLAEASRLYFNYSDAEKAYKKVTQVAREQYPLARFYYGIMLKDNGNYTEAEEVFNQFRTEYSETTLEAEVYKERALQESKGCALAINEMQKPQRDYSFKALPSPINTESSDYSPVIMENDSEIVVTSTRQEATGSQEYGMLGGKFSDNFRFKKTKSGWEAVTKDDDFSKSVNSQFNESAGSFIKINKTEKFYFTRCDEEKMEGNNEIFNCGIYVSTLKAGKWQPAVRLNENINMPGQWNGQPCVSADGKIMFFVSKRPGGLGMQDIWYSTCKNEDEWGPAMNLGDKINTLFTDMSPKYLDKEKVLFFSSNGRENFGGLDVFMVKEEDFEDTVGGKVRNAGFPFNSNRDDFFLTLGQQKGYISSNRDKGMGNDDIYGFDIESKETLIAFINKDSVQDANSISVVGKLVDNETQKPAPDVPITLTDDKKNKLKKTNTNDDGEFRFDNLATDKSYKVLLDEDTASITKDVKYVANNVKVKKSKSPATRTLFENIYFDFDKSALRPEARKVLEDLVKYYKKHPEIQIEMDANTDSYGSDEYNKKLSKERGKAALQFLISNGVNKSALVVTAEGEGKPLATNNTATGRQLNRRIEFFIIGGPGYQTEAMTYVIEPKTTLYSVARKYNMTVDELKALNGLEGDNLMAYRPLRVKRVGEAIIAPESQNEVSPPSGTLPANQKYYVVQPKNTVFSIAREHGMTPEELMKMNGLKNNTIFIGQRLKVKK